MNGQFDIGELTPFRYFATIAVVLGVVFGAISPEDDVRSPLIPYGQWLLQSLIPMAMLVFAHIGLHSCAAFGRQNPWLKLVGSGLVGALLFTPFALTIDIVLFDEPLTNGSWLHPLFDEFCNVVTPLIITWLAINAPWVCGFKFHYASEKASRSSHGSTSHGPTSHGPTSNGPTSNGSTHITPKAELSTSEQKQKLEGQAPMPLAHLVPTELHGDLLYLKAELHYLKIVTTQGSHLALYNLKDALKELDDTQGFQPHRSYWAATAHIVDFIKTGRQGILVLSNGEHIPVSRSKVVEAQKKLCSI